MQHRPTSRYIHHGRQNLAYIWHVLAAPPTILCPFSSRSVRSVSMLWLRASYTRLSYSTDKLSPFYSVPCVVCPCAFASRLTATELKRGRPLFLNKHRYNALKQLYLRHRVAQEVSAIRASSDRVIRENYY